MRPSTYTCLPLVRYGATFSPRHRTTLVQLVSSFHSPLCWSFQRRLGATENLVTALCGRANLTKINDCVLRSWTNANVFRIVRPVGDGSRIGCLGCGR